MSSTASPSTAPTSVHVKARQIDPALERDLHIVETLSRSLDTKFSIAGFRFGWDAFIGFVPVVGDFASLLLSLYPVYLAGRHNLGSVVIAKMLTNVGTDFVIGLVPVIGDFADVAYKANRKNLKLFRDAVDKKYGRQFH